MLYTLYLLALITVILYVRHHYDCESICGDVIIRYPFGIANHCYKDRSFAVTCNSSSSPPKLILSKLNLEVIYIGVEDQATGEKYGELVINIPWVTVCADNHTNPSNKDARWTILNMTGTHFSINIHPLSNTFVSVGCNGSASLYDDEGEQVVSCSSSCNSSAHSESKGLEVGWCLKNLGDLTNLPTSLDKLITYGVKVNQLCQSAFLISNAFVPLLDNAAIATNIRSRSVAPVVIGWDASVVDSASSNIFTSANSVEKFNGLNYDDWSEQIRFALGIMNLDLAILMENEPTAITSASSEIEKSHYEAWERANRLSLNLMRMTMEKSIKPSMPKTEKAKEFMQKIKECSQSDLADKSIVGSLMNELTNRKFDWSQPIHDHVTYMSNLAAKLKTMGMVVSDSFLVQFIINSLPHQFGQFQLNYNTIKDKWNFQELKAMLIQEEGRLRKMKDPSIHFVGHDGASSSKGKPGKKDKKKDKAPKGPKSNIRKEQKCYFCKKSGHFKKECPKKKAWFEKKGIQFDPTHKGK